MKIGVILPHLKQFGGVRRFIEFGNKIADAKFHEITIYVTNGPQQIDWMEFRGRLAGVKELISEQMDVCICGDAPSLPVLRRTKASLKAVFVVFPIQEKYALGAYHKFLGPEFIVIGNGTGWNDNLPSQSNFYTIPGAVNSTMFQRVDVPRQDQTFRVLFMIKNRPWKGMETILRARELLRKEEIKWMCFDNEQHPELTENMGIEFYTGYDQSEMPKIYSQADLFVSAEELAGWQNTTAEAMACGLPVITTEIGTRDFASDKKTAVIIKPGDPKSLAENILLLKNNPKLRELLAKAGSYKIKEFTWTKYTDDVLKLLHRKLKPTTAEEPKEILKEPEIPVKELHIPEISEQAAAIKKKAERIKAAIGIKTAIDTPIEKEVKQQPVIKSESKPFDKYERMGAYHWEQLDAVYAKHLSYIAALFQSIKEMHGLDKVLDIGCGDGRIASEIVKLGFPVIGIDTDETGIELSKKMMDVEVNQGKVQFEKKDYFDFKNPPRYILASELIEHLHKPEMFVEKLLLDNPDIAIVTTPIAKSDGTLWDKNYHVHEYKEEELIDLFKKFLDQYQISIYRLEPYHFYLILEKKNFSILDYLKSLGLYLTHNVTIEGKDRQALIPVADTIMDKIVQTMSNILNNKIKRGTVQIGEKNE